MDEEGDEVWAVLILSLQVFVKGRFQLDAAVIYEEVVMSKIGGRPARE